MNPSIPTPAAFVAARLRRRARRGGTAEGYYRLAMALLDDTPASLDVFGRPVQEFPNRSPGACKRPV